MRILFDSNVLIAAYATRGLCQAVFEFCLVYHRIVISRDILEEVGKNLAVKIKLPAGRIQSILAYLKDHTEMTEAPVMDVPSCRDPKDVKILCAAAGAKADYLVTGDKDLLVLKEVHSIPILSPRNFWLRVRQEKDVS